MRISKQRRTRKMKISIEYSPGRAGVAVYGQRYGGTIKPTSPEAFFIVLVLSTNEGYDSSNINV